MEKFFHPYHMVNMSPWPLIVGFGALSMVMGMIKLFSFYETNLLFMSFVMLLLVSILWWRDVIRESAFQGLHSSVVLGGLMMGMILFIISEVFFFISFFWAFFHSSLSPTIELGSFWPPSGILPFNPFQVPLLNTVILLASGVTVTWAHQFILNNNWEGAKNSLMMTWLLGIYFLMLQGFEYYMASFGISDSVYGSTFFMATGFHGFHVIVGTIFLFFIWNRLIKNQLTSSHHFGFEAAAWYWHFVDVVWLFLFSVVYWWGTWYNSIITFDFQSKMENMMMMSLVESIMLVILVYFVFLILFYKNIMDMESMSSYECGFEPNSFTRIFFSYRFFLISILFIIFDVEISLMLPIPFLMESELGVWIFIQFMLVLIVGLMYEYNYGSLDWLEIRD